ncbi:cytochrome D1 domain-containing protein [Thiobacillus sp. 65-1402]|uniref:cytochrome D1 domain-containing protein n=1 Tax=Thiobacillus sp. 65-1402 TaxID=1895861 RepID=UPI0009684416|nr:cytochrome D1 domain-containing protein [Thiobacillus sp. 65-1402]OJW99866.1 MAG: protein nirF [Thiobacillus sp. 65-1402]
MRARIPVLFLLALGALTGCAGTNLRGTGDLGVVIERASGSVQILDTSQRTSLAKVEGLGDLSHASVSYSRDARYAYVFGRDGGLSKIDLLTQRIDRRIIQGGNSIGGAISPDGKLVAVANYEPGGVKIFDADTLALVADIPASGADGTRSKVVGLVDAPGQRFVFSLFEAGEIWVADMHDPQRPGLRKFAAAGKEPYDGMITSDGRHYAAGLFGEDGVALLDLWNLDAGVRRALVEFGRHGEKLPVYKMPHLEGWAATGGRIVLPAVGKHEVIIADQTNWKEVARVPVAGQAVFAVARPDGRQVWINFAFPDNDTVQVLDLPSQRIVQTLKPGKGVLHLEFSPRGEQVWLSLRDENRIEIYDPDTFARIGTLPAESPSGIFFTVRAHRIGL